jgi:serine/threonine protein kinase
MWLREQMRDMNNDNLNPFLGACVDPPNICLISKYCSKGSLQDIVHNDDIKLDLSFKISLIVDLIKVLPPLSDWNSGIL